VERRREETFPTDASSLATTERRFLGDVPPSIPHTTRKQQEEEEALGQPPRGKLPSDAVIRTAQHIVNRKCLLANVAYLTAAVCLTCIRRPSNIDST
jgi:hypothetical protein